MTFEENSQRNRIVKSPIEVDIHVPIANHLGKPGGEHATHRVGVCLRRCLFEKKAGVLDHTQSAARRTWALFVVTVGFFSANADYLVMELSSSPREPRARWA